MKDKRIQLFALFLINALGIIIYLFNLVVTPYEFTFGTFISGTYWFIILLIPAIIPIIFNNKIWRYITFILGILITIINLFVGLGYILGNQIQLGLIFILYWGVLGITAVVFSYKWIKQ
jgi:hypothetical protein